MGPMHNLAAAGLAKRFHQDHCTISTLPRAGEATYNETTFTATLAPGSIFYEGPCVVDERTGFRRQTVGEAPAVMQGAEVRIAFLPAGIEVGMLLTIERIPGVDFEVQEISAGTNEVTTTLLVERARQLPVGPGS